MVTPTLILYLAFTRLLQSYQLKIIGLTNVKNETSHCFVTITPRNLTGCRSRETPKFYVITNTAKRD